MNTTTASPSPSARVRVWDLPLRVFHWSMAVAFFGAWFTSEDGPRLLHLLFGYSLGALVVFRLVWGLIGTRHARFTDFVAGPRKVLDYLRDLTKGRSPHPVGHNPLGAIAIVLMLSFGIGMAVTGWSMASVQGDESLKELHELIANLFMAMVVLHVLGVIVSSVLHRDNLIRAMVTGSKPVAATPVARRGLVALLLVAVLAAFWGVSLQRGELPFGLSAGAELNEAGEAADGRGDGRGIDRHETRSDEDD